MFEPQKADSHPGKESAFKLLERNDKNTKKVFFDGYSMNHDDIVRLEKIILNNHYLEELSLMDCRLGNEDIILICGAILQNNTLREVILDKGNDDSPLLCELIQLMKTHLDTNTRLMPHS